MTDAGKGHYIVFEDWVELRRFSKPGAALLFQKLTRAFHPGRKVTVFHEQGNVLTLIESPWRFDATSDIEVQRTRNIMKGGGEKNMTNEKENKPVKKFQAGGISAALWANKMTLKDGRHIETLSVSLDRRYKDSDGEWKSSGSFKENDIPKAMLVLAKAYEFMTAKEANDADDTAE
jgi:hypothetical protein